MKFSFLAFFNRYELCIIQTFNKNHTTLILKVVDFVDVTLILFYSNLFEHKIRYNA